MSDAIITVRLPQPLAAFLQANLSMLASTTRQAMSRPGIEAERRTALGNRAVLLERIEDAVHGALLEPPTIRKGSSREESRAAANDLARLSAA